MHVPVPTVEAELAASNPSFLFALLQRAGEQQFDKIASDIKVCTKQKFVIEFLPAEKIAPTG